MGGYCCRSMRDEVERRCDVHADRYECPDCLVSLAADGSYGLIIHDGGSSVSSILYCPWCGSPLTDGSVDATIDPAVGDGLKFDLVPTLERLDEATLSDAARRGWDQATARMLIEAAAAWDGRVEKQITLLAQDEASGKADGHECWVDSLAADDWMRRPPPT